MSLAPASDDSAGSTQNGERLQLVSFIVAGEEFGVDILKVQEIIRPIEITRVPNAPEFVEGVVNLRGGIVPVVDLRERFGFPSREQDDSTRIVVTEVDGQVIGFVTDAVKEVIRIEREVIDEPPELAVGIDAHYIRSVARLEDRLLILLDLSAVISTEETEVLNKLEGEAEAPSVS